MALMLAASAAAGCGPPPIAPPPGLPNRTMLRLPREIRPVLPPLFRPAQADRAALPAVIKASNAFALDLYHVLRSQAGNIVVSPACLTPGLAMLRAGARGETAAEIDRALHRSGAFPDGALAALIQDLNVDGPDRSFQVRLADAVWLQEAYPIEDAYRATLRDVFACDDERRVDFTGDPHRAARRINAWVAVRTGGKIAGTVTPEAVAPPTKMVLSSALYFRGNWAKKFGGDRTREALFHISRSETVAVPMMHQHPPMKAHGYADLGSYQVLSLSCGQGAFAMVVLLPKSVDGLGDLEAALTPETLEAVWPRLKYPEEMDISFPKFRLRTSPGMKPVLEKLGICRAFDRSRADFSGINGKTNDLFVRAAMHDTYLDVNEEGIEAAAATESIAADSFEDQPPVVVADHPFFYLLRDERSGCIVFMGRVVNPVEAPHP
jgi:serpin B